MKTLIFQPRFAELVRTGKKLQTIRPPRKNPIKAGEWLSLREWTGKPYRSKQRKLREVVCVSAGNISISETHEEFIFEVAGIRLTPEEWAAFCRADGFDCTTDLLNWFRETHGLPFSGTLIKWL